MADSDLTPVFFGEYEHNVDDKNRLCINSGFRSSMSPEALAKGFVLTRGYDGCLALYTLAGFMAMSSNIGETRYSDPQTRAYIRDLFRKAANVVPDSQGRIVLPQRLRQESHIGKACVEIGARTHIEIWACDLHEVYWDENAGAAERGAGAMPF